MSKEQEILITGSSGLVGSKIVDVLSPQYSFHGVGTKEEPSYPGFENLNKYSQCDITDIKALEKLVDESEADIIIHCGAYFPGVDPIESQRQQGIESEAWKVNVIGSEELAKLGYKYKKHIIVASSTYVYDGKSGPYKETDDPALSDTSVMSFYGIIKREQERVVSDNCDSWSAFRFEMPYREFFTKPDFARRLITLFKEGKLKNMYSDQTITPISLEELAKALQILIDTKAQDVFHIGSSDVTSPHQFAMNLINTIFGEGTGNSIQEASYENSSKDPTKAPRPLHGGVLMERIIKLGYQPKKNNEMIQAFAADFLSTQI